MSLALAMLALVLFEWAASKVWGFCVILLLFSNYKSLNTMKKSIEKLSLETLNITSFATAIRGGNDPINGTKDNDKGGGNTNNMKVSCANSCTWECEAL